MKIYILYFADYDTFKIIDVFKSKERAELEIPMLDKKYYDRLIQVYKNHPLNQRDEIKLENMHHILEKEVIE